MNSGMNRLGFTPAAFRSAWQRLSGLTQVDEITLMTHLSDADGDPKTSRGIAHQLDAFDAVTHDLAGERSICNSAATLRFAPRAGRGARRLGAPRHHVVRLVARLPRCTAARTGICSPR